MQKSSFLFGIIIITCSFSINASDRPKVATPDHHPDYPGKNEQIEFYKELYSAGQPHPVKPTLLQRLAIKRLRTEAVATPAPIPKN
jgi:hypothetical protein